MCVCRERSLSLDEQRLISREVITDVEKGVVADQFYAERLYTPEALRRLLEKAGFSGVAFHEIATESQRNQDLGMMERRHIVTAVVRKEWSAVKARGRERAKHVAVMLGDPAKPDALKPSCTFDDDDFYTIDQMKAALRELSGYRFTFLCKHDTLIQDLPKLKGKVDYVFNLCDEGFNNDPRKELHVPALLEMSDIPYTGSGPQSLAFCYDKSLVCGIAKEMGIPVPDACFITPGDRTYDVGMKLPAIVKPNAGDSSYGITQRSIAHTIEELSDVISTLRTALGYDRSLLVEEFLTGKDISVGIIGNPPGYSLPVRLAPGRTRQPETPRGQPEPRLVLGRPPRKDGEIRGPDVCRDAQADPQSRGGAVRHGAGYAGDRQRTAPVRPRPAGGLTRPFFSASGNDPILANAFIPKRPLSPADAGAGERSCLREVRPGGRGARKRRGGRDRTRRAAAIGPSRL